jgi:hypothetical protein
MSISEGYASALMGADLLLGPTEYRRVEIVNAGEHGMITITFNDNHQFSLEIYPGDPVETLCHVFSELQTYLSENGPSRSNPRPRCKSGHAHPADCGYDDGSVVLTCPMDGTIVERVVTFHDERKATVLPETPAF